MRLLARVELGTSLVAVLVLIGCGGEERSNGDGGGKSSGGTSTSGGSSSGGTLGGAGTATGGRGGAATGGASGASPTGGTSGTASGGTSPSGGTSGGGEAGASSGDGGQAGAGATSGGGGEGGARTCADPCPSQTPDCCGSQCVDTWNDPRNCGECGNVCEGDTPYCSATGCTAAPCEGTSCGAGQSCCGSQCCSAGQICCWRTAGCCINNFCHTPTAEQPTCPNSCRACGCASPDTPIATPDGERPISELSIGDLVYSVDRAAIVVVPIVNINRVSVNEHRVMRVGLDNGSVLEISERHPTADGRTFAALSVGTLLDGKAVVSTELVPYAHPFTYDILPASETGAYFAGGALIGSTLAPPL